MELWQIILGILTATFLIFLKNAHSKAHQQKIAAIRLRAYLLHWQKFILDNDLFSIFHMGIDWNKKIVQILKDGGGAEDLVALENEKKKEIDGLKEQFIIELDDKKIDKDNIQKALKKLPPNMTDIIYKYAMTREQNLLDGKTFINDEEASSLGLYTAQVSIELKMLLIALINNGLGLLIEFISSPEDFDLKKRADDIVKLVWNGIVVSKHIDTLTKQTELITSLSVFELTKKNLKGEL